MWILKKKTTKNKENIWSSEVSNHVSLVKEWDRSQLSYRGWLRNRRSRSFKMVKYRKQISFSNIYIFFIIIIIFFIQSGIFEII